MFDLKITERTHELLKPYIEPGDLAIDATLGNGNDALFLYQAVGEEGVVIGLDILSEALVSSTKLFKDRYDLCRINHRVDSLGDENKNIHLLEYSHDKLKELMLPRRPKVIFFNLGYFPDTSKALSGENINDKGATVTEVTLEALKQSSEVIDKGGVLSIVTYPGHGEGKREHEAVVLWLQSLAPKDFEVITIVQTNRSSRTPVQHLVHKKRN